MKKHFFILIIVSSLLSSCAMNQEDIGAISGASIGALVGNNFGKGSSKVAAIGLGMLVGTAIGGQIGRSMDVKDRQHLRNALEYEPIDKTVNWTNPDTQINYEVTPKRTYFKHDAQGDSQPCREYTTVALIGGKKETVYGTACRMADGSWKVQ